MRIGNDKNGCEENFAAYDQDQRPKCDQEAPNLWRYSADEMNALTISAFKKSPPKEFSLLSQKLKPAGT
jgi:hypothetical protein